MSGAVIVGVHIAARNVHLRHELVAATLEKKNNHKQFFAGFSLNSFASYLM
jgi:hypothetical protein